MSTEYKPTRQEKPMTMLARTLRPPEGEIVTGTSLARIIDTLLTLQLSTLYNRESNRATASFIDEQHHLTYVFGKTTNRRFVQPYWYFNVVEEDGAMLQARVSENSPFVDIYLRHTIVGQALLPRNYSTASLQLVPATHEKEYHEYHIPVLTAAVRRAVDLVLTEEENKLLMREKMSNMTRMLRRLLDKGGLIHLRFHGKTHTITEIISTTIFEDEDAFAASVKKYRLHSQRSSHFTIWPDERPLKTTNGIFEGIVILDPQMKYQQDGGVMIYDRDVMLKIITVIVQQEQKTFPRVTSGGKKILPMGKPSVVASQIIERYLAQERNY